MYYFSITLFTKWYFNPLIHQYMVPWLKATIDPLKENWQPWSYLPHQNLTDGSLTISLCFFVLAPNP